MKKFALAIAAAALLASAAPSFVATASATPVVSQDATDVSSARVVKKVIVRRGRPHRMGRHDMGRHMGATKRVVIKHRGGGKVVKKTVIRR